MLDMLMSFIVYVRGTTCFLEVMYEVAKLRGAAALALTQVALTTSILQ